MNIHEKVGQLFVIEPDALLPSFTDSFTDENKQAGDGEGCKSVDSEMKYFYEDYPAGGFIFFSRNISDKKQLKTFTSSLKNLSRIPLMIAIDEEGGRVSRITGNASLGTGRVPPMQMIGNMDEKKAEEAGAYIGNCLYSFGFTADFAPVADVNLNPENSVIGDRAFSENPLLTAKMCEAFLEGLHSQKISGCLKHFPGHGGTFSDTHTGEAVVNKNWNELNELDLIPFRYNIRNAEMIMLSHVSFPEITFNFVPASLSSKVIRMLRSELEYDGVIITDALNMGAVKNYKNAALIAFEAGADLLLMPENYPASYNEIKEAVFSGRISVERLDRSVLRILKMKMRFL